MLSQRSRYAMKALIHLAQGYGREPRQVSQISEAENIPRKFLEAIFSDLRRANLVTSARGKHGGYELARTPDKITFGEVLRVTDGPLALVPCASKQFYRRCDDCVDEASCAIRHIFANVRDEVSAILDSTSLAQAIALNLPLDEPAAA